MNQADVNNMAKGLEFLAKGLNGAISGIVEQTKTMQAKASEQDKEAAKAVFDKAAEVQQKLNDIINSYANLHRR